MMKKRWLLLCLLLLLSGCTQQNVEKMPEEPPVTVGESTSGTPMPENEAEQPALSADLEELNRVHTPALYAMGGYGSWDDPTVMRPDSFFFSLMPHSPFSFFPSCPGSAAGPRWRPRASLHR